MADNNWEHRKLNTIVERVTRKNKNNESTLPLTISAQDGLVDQNTYFNKQVASKDMSNYYLLMKGDFAYNKSYSNGFPLGTVKRLDKYDQGALSSLYIVFRPKKVNTDFLSIYYDTNKWHREVMKLSAEGARNHGLLNIPVNSFFEKNIIIPIPEKEQLEIAKFLKRLEKIIALHRRKRNILQKLKQIYLMKMNPKKEKISPELYFSNCSRTWEQRKLSSIYNVTMGHSPKSENYTSNPEDYILVQGNADIKNGWVKPRVWTTQITSLVMAGSILLSVRAPVGNVGKTSYDVVIGRGIASIEGDEFIYQLLSKMHMENFWRKFSTGSTFESINSKDIKDALIKVPTKKEREKIGSFLEIIDSYIVHQNDTVDSLIKLKDSYLAKMFL